MNFTPAFRAWHFQGAEIPGNRVVLKLPGTIHNAPGHVGDSGHELAAADFAPLHFPQLKLPFPRQLRLGQFLHAQAVQQLHQRKRLRRGLQLTAVAMNVILVNQSFDNRRARRRRAEAFLAHRFAQFVVVHQFARTFHRRQQRRFGISCRRFRHVFLDLDGAGRHGFARFDRGKTGRFLRIRLFAIDREPAWIDQYFAGALERFARHPGEAVGFQKFRGRIKNRQKPLCHQVVKFLLRLGQMFGSDGGGDDGKVVRNLGVVENALVRMHPAAFQDFPGKRPKPPQSFQHSERVFDRSNIILRQGARIGTRIGQNFVPFVKCLGEPQRVFGAEAKSRVRVALQTRQIIEQRREGGGRLAFFRDHT